MHEPSFDFDRVIDRAQTSATKWNKYPGGDVIPMWVADMDFATSPAIIHALRTRAEHGVFGYTDPPEPLTGAIADALRRDYGWRVEPEWLMWLPGLVSGLNLVCRAIGTTGDEVITATPVYHPFLSAPINQQRSLVRVPMTLEGTRWKWDLERLEASITPRSRLLLLCNPHNPVGRVFTREELRELAQIAQRHRLVICSDEIHCGLVLDTDKRHVSLAALDEAIAQRTITLMAASKTFNLPGLGCAFAVVPGRELRAQLSEAAAGILPRPNIMGYVATLAAYRDSDAWRRALLDYLRANRYLVVERIARMPGLAITPIEATYLAWIDARGSGLVDPALLFERAGVGLYDGRVFGGEGYVRLNFGCPRSLLIEALDRMEHALQSS